MDGGISAPFIRYPVATTLLMVGILFVGLAAYPFLPVAPLPQVDFPTIQVSAQLPGASPETMASSVAQPLERQFGQIPGVTADVVHERARLDARITVQFDLDRNIDAAAQDIQAAINAAGGQLPKNLPSPPTYRKVNPADTPILIISVTSDALPLTEVDDNAGHQARAADQPDRRRRAGLIGGQQKPAVRVQLDPAKLAAKNLSLEDVRAKLDVATVDAAQGLDRRRDAQLHDLRQRPADPGGGLERRHRRLSERRPDPGAGHRPGGVGAREHEARRLGRTASAASSSSSSSSPAPTSSRRSTG